MSVRRRKNARPPAPTSEREVEGLRYLRLIESQFTRLRASPSHGHREVFLDHIVIAHLLCFFNPQVKGLRSVEDIFNLPGLQARYGVPRLPNSTVAYAQAVFDPQLLRPILDSLFEKANIQPHYTRLDGGTRKLLAVDGSFFAVAPRIAWDLFNKSCGKGGANTAHVRPHVQFYVRLGLPVETSLTDCQSAEWKQWQASLRADCFYLMDRGLGAYELLATILDFGSDFLVRLRKSAHCDVVDHRPLTAADQAAGISGDSNVRIGWRADQTPALPTLRRVEVHYTDREGTTTALILLTNRLDLPAWMIALIYRHRWQIEMHQPYCLHSIYFYPVTGRDWGICKAAI